MICERVKGAAMAPKREPGNSVFERDHFEGNMGRDLGFL